MIDPNQIHFLTFMALGHGIFYCILRALISWNEDKGVPVFAGIIFFLFVCSVIWDYTNGFPFWSMMLHSFSKA